MEVNQAQRSFTEAYILRTFIPRWLAIAGPDGEKVMFHMVVSDCLVTLGSH